MRAPPPRRRGAPDDGCPGGDYRRWRDDCDPGIERGRAEEGRGIKAEIDSDVPTSTRCRPACSSIGRCIYNIYDSLVAIDTDLKIIPSLALSRGRQPDPKTYIFNLRQGVKYHDGTDFNADSVKWNIERYLTDKNEPPRPRRSARSRRSR